ncbi:hypothetical protein WDW37_18430 [Bdellovibrionota bacterium FG-1]
MKILPEFSCVVAVMYGELHRCPMVNGTPQMYAGQLNWIEVRAPITREFLDAVNKALGTRYKVEDFEDVHKLVDEHRGSDGP